MESKNRSKLDQEWIGLIKEAKDLGITKDEVRTFFLENEERPVKKRTSKAYKNNPYFYATS